MMGKLFFLIGKLLVLYLPPQSCRFAGKAPKLPGIHIFLSHSIIKFVLMEPNFVLEPIVSNINNGKPSPE